MTWYDMIWYAMHIFVVQPHLAAEIPWHHLTRSSSAAAQLWKEPLVQEGIMPETQSHQQNCRKQKVLQNPDNTGGQSPKSGNKTRWRFFVPAYFLKPGVKGFH